MDISLLFSNIIKLLLLILCSQFVFTDSSSWTIVNDEYYANRVLGLPSDLTVTDADFYHETLKFKVNFQLLQSPKYSLVRDANIFNGKGIIFKPSEKPIIFDVILPLNNSNICGFIIGSGIDSSDYMRAATILWRHLPNHPWTILSNPSTGNSFFEFDFQSNTDKRVLFIDSVPASEIRIIFYPIDGKGSSLTISVTHGCQYSSTVTITDCKETFENNENFQDINFNGPLSIQCPTDCKHSHYCKVAFQNFGNRGDGKYFLYFISNIARFRSEMNPALNNGIFCRRSNIPGSGITFLRSYYDFSIQGDKTN